MKVAALAGRAVHAERHVGRGVDIVVAQGHEAGGHTGEIASMVLWPEIVDAVGDKAFVLGAGGVGSGRQIAAALALGCDGVWMGSMWLTAQENQLMQQVGATTQALLNATSADTVRTRIYTGKPARLLKTQWTQSVGRGRRARTAADAAAEPARRRSAPAAGAVATTPSSSRCRSDRSSDA